jgi:hypothetical protein
LVSSYWRKEESIHQPEATMSDIQDSTTTIETNGDDDLYGDLDVDVKNVAGKKKKMTDTSTNNQHRRHYLQPDDRESTREENKMLKERIRTLEEENLILKRNIGTLFRTAKNEIQRKDGQIIRLQQQQQQG